jgi:hypothetical protein
LNGYAITSLILQNIDYHWMVDCSADEMTNPPQVFMTRRNDLTCIHEPFGDAFYFGPERLGNRYEGDEKARQESGFAESTYQTILDRIDHESEEVR